jgi:transposase
MHERALCVVKAGEEVVPATEPKALKAKIRELELLLGRKTMEVEILEEAIPIAREKNCWCENPGPRRTISREDNHRDT